MLLSRSTEFPITIFARDTDILLYAVLLHCLTRTVFIPIIIAIEKQRTNDYHDVIIHSRAAYGRA